MKKNKGFTLIELLAVIVILAVIALIATPLIMGTITNAKKNAFRDTAYGILKAGEKYTAEILLESENTYPGETITIPETEGKKLNYKGEEPRGGKMVITKDGDISLIIYNDSWCAKKAADDKEVSVEKYDKNTCKVDGENKNTSSSQTIIDKNISENKEGLFTDDFGNVRYRGNNDEVKNYITFNNEVWRIIGVFDGKLKLVRNESLGDMKWNETAANNNWDSSTLKAYLNGEYYNSLNATSKNQIETSIFYLGGHDTASGMYAKTIYREERGTNVYTGNPTTTTQNIGLMYPSDYGYAVRSSCTKDLYNYNQDENCRRGGNWLSVGKTEWLQTPNFTNAHTAFYVRNSGYVEIGTHVISGFGVRPSLFLKSNIEITGGEGTSTNPYIIS